LQVGAVMGRQIPPASQLREMSGTHTVRLRSRWANGRERRGGGDSGQGLPSLSFFPGHAWCALGEAEAAHGRLRGSGTGCAILPRMYHPSQDGHRMCHPPQDVPFFSGRAPDVPSSPGCAILLRTGTGCAILPRTSAAQHSVRCISSDTKPGSQLHIINITWHAHTKRWGDSLHALARPTSCPGTSYLMCCHPLPQAQAHPGSCPATHLSHGQAHKRSRWGRYWRGCECG